MLRQGIQRVARLAPGTARALWTRLPSRAKSGLESLFYPIALGSRGSGLSFEVEPGEARRFDVVVAAADDGAVRLASELECAGHRVFELSGAELEKLARDYGTFDGVVLGAAPQSR